MAQTAEAEQPTAEPEETTASGYLNRALEILKQLGISPSSNETPELVRLLEEVRHLDEPKVLAIARTVQHMQAFNALVREHVEDIKVGNRYIEIAQSFDSIREDSKGLIAQLDDGVIDFKEKMHNLGMKIRRGSPHSRFEKIADTYREVSGDTKDQLEREMAIMDAYIDFRFSLKEAESLAHELQADQIEHLNNAKEGLATAQKAVDDFAGDDEAERSRIEMARDEARRAFELEDRRFQLLKDIAENLSVGYDVGETLVAKLRQTHDAKDQVWRRSVTFFTTNEHVFTILATVYTSQRGLHEVTQATEALKEGVNAGLEDVAGLGRSLERAALKAGYGSTINPESVQKLVTAISDYQVDSLKLVADLRKESEENAREIRRIVEQGKQRYNETLGRYAAGEEIGTASDAAALESAKAEATQ